MGTHAKHLPAHTGLCTGRQSFHITFGRRWAYLSINGQQVMCRKERMQKKRFCFAQNDARWWSTVWSLILLHTALLKVACVELFRVVDAVRRLLMERELWYPCLEIHENVAKYGEVIDAPILSGTELLLDFVLPMLFLKSEIDIALDLACRFFADYEYRRTPIEWSVEVDECEC